MDDAANRVTKSNQSVKSCFSRKNCRPQKTVSMFSKRPVMRLRTQVTENPNESS